MKAKTLLFWFVLSALTVSAFAAQGGSDPLSGTWSGDWGPTATHRNPVTVELKWDGKALTGSVNPGPQAVALQKASFDPATGAVRMEAEAMGRGGVVRYTIEGKLANGMMTGSWNHDAVKGDFKIAKK